LKIASFNVNGITARLPNLLRWLAETRPDVACLQELKVPHDRFPRWATLAKLPLRIACWLMSPNQRSTRLSHEALVGVKCR